MFWVLPRKALPCACTLAVFHCVPGAGAAGGGSGRGGSMRRLLSVGGCRQCSPWRPRCQPACVVLTPRPPFPAGKGGFGRPERAGPCPARVVRTFTDEPPYSGTYPGDRALVILSFTLYILACRRE